LRLKSYILLFKHSRLLRRTFEQEYIQMSTIFLQKTKEEGFVFLLSHWKMKTDKPGFTFCCYALLQYFFLFHSKKIKCFLRFFLVWPDFWKFRIKLVYLKFSISPKNEEKFLFFQIKRKKKLFEKLQQNKCKPWRMS